MLTEQNAEDPNSVPNTHHQVLSPSGSSLLASSGNYTHVLVTTHLTHTHNIGNRIHPYWKREMNNKGGGSASQNGGDS